MARKPTLSPSKISTFLACPAKYYWTYINEEGRFFMRGKSYFSFGSSLHSVLQNFHDEGNTQVTTVEEALADLEENWISAGYSSAQEMEEALGQGKQILEAYIQRHVETPTQARTILIEKQLRHDLGDFVLIGRVDRVDEHEDGTLEVIDYKSGRETVDVADIENDLAMGCYQVLLRAKYPGQPVRATIIALKTGASATASLQDEEQFLHDLREIGQVILNKAWDEYRPKPIDLCSTCDFLPLCRRAGYDES